MLARARVNTALLSIGVTLLAVIAFSPSGLQNVWAGQAQNGKFLMVPVTGPAGNDFVYLLISPQIALAGHSGPQSLARFVPEQGSIIHRCSVGARQLVRIACKLVASQHLFITIERQPLA